MQLRDTGIISNSNSLQKERSDVQIAGSHLGLLLAFQNSGFPYQKVLHTKDLQTLGGGFLSIHEEKLLSKRIEKYEYSECQENVSNYIC